MKKSKTYNTSILHTDGEGQWSWTVIIRERGKGCIVECSSMNLNMAMGAASQKLLDYLDRQND